MFININQLQIKSIFHIECNVESKLTNLEMSSSPIDCDQGRYELIVTYCMRLGDSPWR